MTTTLPSALLRTLAVTFFLLLLQYALVFLYQFATSGELAARVADAVEARQTWRLHHSHEREVFTCLLCGHAVQTATGHGVHKDAYACIQCNHTSFASECNATLPHKHYQFQVDMVVAAYDLPAPLPAFLRFVLTLSPLTVHPVALACVLLSVSSWLLYARFLYGVVVALRRARELAQLKVMEANRRAARPPPSVEDTDSLFKEPAPLSLETSFGDLRQRVVSR